MTSWVDLGQEIPGPARRRRAAVSRFRDLSFDRVALCPNGGRLRLFVDPDRARRLD